MLSTPRRARIPRGRRGTKRSTAPPPTCAPPIRRAWPSISRRAASPTRSTTRRRRRRASSARNHVDNSARLCHAASTAAMKATLGYGASTCSYADWLHADLIVLFGSNVANNQPVTHEVPAPRQGERRRRSPWSTRIASPVWRATGCPRLRRARVRAPTLADHWFDVHTGGDLRVPGRRAASAHRDAAAWTRRSSANARRRIRGGARPRRSPRAGQMLERESGAPRARMRGVRAAADRPAERRLRLVDGPHAARPRRRHGQGARQRRPRARTAGPSASAAWCRSADTPACRAARKSGASPTARRRDGRPLGRRLGISRRRRRRDGPPAKWSITPRRETSTCSGSSAAIFSRRCPTSIARAARSSRPRLRVHQDIVVSSSMLVDERRRRPAAAGHDALRVAGRRHGNVNRAAHHLLAGDPGAPHRIRAAGVAGVRRGDGARPSRRARIRFVSRAPRRSARKSRAPSRCIAGIEPLCGRRAIRFSGAGRSSTPTAASRRPDGKAHFSPVVADGSAETCCLRRQRAVRTGPLQFRVSTRRGKQFNSMVQRHVDPADRRRSRRGAHQRARILRRLGLAEGARVRLRSPSGQYRGPLEGGADQARQSRSALAGRQRPAVGTAIDPGFDGARLQRARHDRARHRVSM